MKECKNIFIDTSVFEKECFRFDENSKFARLVEFQEKGDIKLYITDIIKDELISRIEYNVKEEYPQYNKLRIISNIYNKNENDFINELKKRLELNIKNFEIIPTDTNITKDIFDNYFSNKPPFDKEKKDKKNEFPDAFIIEMVKKWAEKNYKKVIFLSNDNDCATYIENSNGIISLKKDIKEILDELNSEDECYKKAIEIFDENIVSIEEEIEQIVLAIPYDKYEIYYASMRDYKDGFNAPDYEIESIDYEGDFKIIEKDIVFISTTTKETYINIKVSYNINAYFELEDYSEASYDDESDKYYNLKQISKSDDYVITLEDIELLIDTENNTYELLSKPNDFSPEIRFFEPISK